MNRILLSLLVVGCSGRTDDGNSDDWDALRRAAGEAGYSGGFIEHYLGAIIYPAGLTRNAQWLAAGVLGLINVVAYSLVIARVLRTRR